MHHTLWRIELLGRLSILGSGECITRFRTHKTAALLAYLAYHRGQSLARDAVIELFWPGASPDAGRNNLSVALNSLRHQLEAPMGTTGTVLVADRWQISLNPAAFSTDVETFETCIQQALRTQEPEESMVQLVEAIDSYRGPLLPEQYEDWVLRERQRLADAYLNALRQLVKLLALQKEWERALDYALRAVQADVLREESHRNLMRLYLALGRPAAALAQYRELERVLSADMACAPSAGTQELVAQIVQSLGPAANTLLPATQAATSIDRPNTPAGVAPPPRPSSQTGIFQTNVRSNLSLQFTRFFGRDYEIEQLERLLQSNRRLVTLVGMGGCGKTRLAIEIGARLQTHFQGRVWFVSLVEQTEPDAILPIIRDTLTLPRISELEPLEQIALQLSGSPSLLIVDNFEQLLDQGALYLQKMLHRVPSLTLLVTSRQSLNLDGEQEFAVQPLSIPQHIGLPERLLESASVQLFVDRARARRFDFQLNRHNIRAVGTLCQRLEGIPLAIELAASWAKTLTPQQMLSELDQRFEFLVSKRPGLPERHRIMRATLDTSFRLLSPQLQSFLVRLCVFRGG